MSALDPHCKDCGSSDIHSPIDWRSRCMMEAARVSDRNVEIMILQAEKNHLAKTLIQNQEATLKIIKDRNRIKNRLAELRAQIRRDAVAK